MQRRHFLAAIGGFGLAACAAEALKSDPATPDPAVSPVANPEKLQIIVISDLNSQYGSTDYEPEVDRGIKLIIERKPSLVLCGGDMVAGQKTSLTESRIRAMWAAFDRHITAPLRKAKIPFGFTIGNHDASGALAGDKFIFSKERDLARTYWNQPEHSTGLNFIDKTGFPFYYSFLQDGIFYLVWDASTSIISPEQLAWAGKSLAGAAAKTAKMRVAIGHLPLYGIAVGRDNPGNYLASADRLRQFLENNGVTTYISGHAHAYYPGKRGQLELLHAGALGSGPRRLLNQDLPPRKTLTIVDVDLKGQDTVYTTYDMKTMKMIDINSLPRFIMAPNGKVSRRDLPSV